MSDPKTTPIPVAGAAPTRALPATGGEVLVRAAGIELLGETPGSGYRNPPALVRRADGQVITLTPLLQQVLLAVDGRRTVDEVAGEVSASSGRLVRGDDVRQLVDASLRPLGLLLRADGTEPELRRSDPLLALSFRRVVTDPAVTRRLTAPFALLFSPLFVVPVVLAFGAISGWVLFSQGLAAATAQAFGNPALFLAVVVLTVLSAGFHEFGHAAAARYGGSTPGAMGFGFYLFWPAFYTDVTDSYRLGRGGRVRTDLGGLYFNALVVLAVFGVWWLTGWHAVLLIVATQILQMVRQLLPLLRFDGYHVLADLTGVPDLYQRIGPIMTGLLPGRWHQPEATALKPWARAVVVTWILLVVPLMAGSLLLMVLALPRLLASAWAGVQRQAGLLGAAFDEGDILGVLARALAVVVVVLPILGLLYVLARLARSAAVGVWRRTEDRPTRRALALLLAAALVLGLGWAWWPAEDRYRPVRAFEGGTVLDAVTAAGSGPLEAGSQGAAPTIWPEDAGPLPTEDRPALAMVLVPAADGAAGADGVDGGGAAEGDGDGAGAAAGDGDAAVEAPTWVFPFNRPPAPGEGDNQALAVNTEDGSVVYDVTFALVWADEDAVLNRNEAYALASCRDCRTVAVAFQVVLVVGSVDVVVPQNLAAAVNYACLQCVTQALATQLVVSLPGELSEDGTRYLAAIWAELAEFGEQIEGVPLAELRDRLTEFETRILDVVRADAETSGTEPAQPAEPSEDVAGEGDPADGSAPSSGSAGSTRAGTSAASSGSTATGDPGPSSSASAQTTTPAPPPSSAPAETTSATASSTPSG
ncbi:M50 family peptidase [Blastococcus sp. CT_GayMR19]|uniref:M50 family metallopeptidase n=1 Tax=Blastococcus sp. CT_GayMR19 TaxID=2559608 RepID=UPI0010730305|nr:M50 family metallopeptidase [Blastococcus sp. CT_GayMR19]TFV73901.1 M50 family peptidase [Blastococcus sp. CT_GayMR19]